MIFLALGVQLYTPARKSSAVTGTYIKMYEIMIKMFCAGGILLPRTCFEADFFFVFVSRRKDFGFGISAGMLLIELNKSRGRWLCALECEVNLAESARCVTVYPVPTLLLPLTSTTCNKCNNGNDSYYSGGFEAQYS